MERVGLEPTTTEVFNLALYRWSYLSTKLVRLWGLVPSGTQALPWCGPACFSGGLDGIRTHDLLRDREARTPGSSTRPHGTRAGTRTRISTFAEWCDLRFTTRVCCDRCGCSVVKERLVSWLAEAKLDATPVRKTWRPSSSRCAGLRRGSLRSLPSVERRLVPGGRVELPRVSAHRPLRPARLPVPPPRLMFVACRGEARRGARPADAEPVFVPLRGTSPRQSPLVRKRRAKTGGGRRTRTSEVRRRRVYSAVESPLSDTPTR